MFEDEGKGTGEDTQVGVDISGNNKLICPLLYVADCVKATQQQSLHIIQPLDDYLASYYML